MYTLGNLGVNCVLVSSDEELCEKIETRTYAFIFISYALYAKNKDTILKFGTNAKIVILTEFGETIQDKNLSTIAMPVHSISIANVLNGTLDSFSYSESNELIVRFTAPQANVLVVDDIITNLKIVKGLLLPYKMQVDLCKSGKMAIEAVKSNHYDIVFMDHKMPEMDGVETTQYIRAWENDKNCVEFPTETPKLLRSFRIPIIALTANAVAGTKEMFMENGFDDFLSKPIDTIRLNAVLEKWIPREKWQ
jgi:CheY-like chemotaxis protein